MDIEKIIITGNVTADAKVIINEKGRFTSFTVACNISKDEANFYSVAVSGDNITKYLTKGKKVAVTGNPSAVIGKPNQYGVQEIYRSIKRAEVTLL